MTAIEGNLRTKENFKLANQPFVKAYFLRFTLSSTEIEINNLALLLKSISPSIQNFELCIFDTGLPISIHTSVTSILASYE